MAARGPAAGRGPRDPPPRPARHGHVAELADEPWIVGDPDPLLDVWPRSPATRRVAYTARDWPARLGLVAAGLGITPVPTVAAGTIPPGIRLVAVDEPQPVLRSIVAVTRGERSPNALALQRALARRQRRWPRPPARRSNRELEPQALGCAHARRISPTSVQSP
jgi:DNA-binding transcriptional LysR family regulator